MRTRDDFMEKIINIILQDHYRCGTCKHYKNKMCMQFGIQNGPMFLCLGWETDETDNTKQDNTG